MRVKSRLLLIGLAMAMVVSSCSSSSDSTESTDKTPRSKNAALPVATTVAPADTATTTPADTTATTTPDSTATTTPDSTATTTPDSTATTTPGDTTDGTSKSKTSAQVDVAFTETIVVPSKLCNLIGLDCAALDFAEVTFSSPTSFVVAATIPSSTIKLPAGKGYGFEIGKTQLIVAADGGDYEYSVNSDVKLGLGGPAIPLTLVGTFIPKETTVVMEMYNNEVNYNDALGIPGFNIKAISGKNTFVGGVPKGMGFSISGTIPKFLGDLGINPSTPFTAAMEVGVGVTVAMSLGDKNGADIFNIKNVLSAKFIQASYSSQGATIGGVSYKQGLGMAFSGKFGKTPVMVDGAIGVGSYNIEFEVGAFELGGFQFDEATGSLVRDSSGLNLGFSGGLSGYGITGRMKGSFDPYGGISLLGEGAFKPGGVDLGSLKLDFVANQNGVKFVGTGSQKFGVIQGATTVGFKSFPNNKFGFEMGVGGGLAIPGAPQYASVDGSLSITNCPRMECSEPLTLPKATLAGSASLYKMPKQSFSFEVNPNGWSFREELKFNFDENLGYESNGFKVGVRAWGQGAIVISDKGISLGKGSLNATAGFKTPDVYIPKQTVAVTVTRLPKVITSCSYWKGTKVVKKCESRTEYYTNRTGGQTISEATTIKGIDVKLGASVGIDDKGFYIDVTPGKEVKGARLYFKL